MWGLFEIDHEFNGSCHKNNQDFMEGNRVFFVFGSEFRSFEKQRGHDTEVVVWWKGETFVTRNVKSLSTKFCGFFVYILQKCAEK